MAERDLPDYDEPWVECWSCGGEGFHEDCFEDCCVCLNPPCHRVRCDECKGRGGWSEDVPTRSGAER